MSSITLLYGTGNPAKLASMRRGLAGLNVKILGLEDMPSPPPEVEESGASPLENARLKAHAYYEHYEIPVFSCDSGLYFDGLPEEEQPGINVRTVKGRRLSDPEMVEHYAALARRYNNPMGRYINAICLVTGEGEWSAMDDTLATDPFVLTSQPHAQRREGFPLDSLSLDAATGKYYYDLDCTMVDGSVIEIGVAQFLKRVLPITEDNNA